MLPAKLFALLVVAFAICTGLAWLNPFPGTDIYVRDTYFAVGPTLVPLFCAVASLNFAVLYYAAARFFHARWNRTLSILHFSLFVCFGVSLSVVFVMSQRFSHNPGAGEALRWLVIPWFLGMFSLFISFLVFAVNLALTVARVVRARFAIH